MGEPQGYDRKEILYRIGTFFLLVGLGMLVFFLMSEAEQKPLLSFFCWSIILLMVGFFFRAQYKKSTASSGRFSILKKILKGKK
jgi:hypothetical protein